MALCLLAAALGYLDGLGRADAIFLDGLTHLSERKASDDIVIVAIDEQSLATLGRWPWRRSIHAELLQRLANYRPAVVGLDLIFSEPAADHPDDDLLLANALRRGPPSVLPVVMETRAQQHPQAVLPTTRLEQATARQGHIHIELDQDGIVRSVFLREGIEGRWWDYLAVAMLASTPGGSSIAAQLPGVRRPVHSDTFGSPNESRSSWQRDYCVRIAFAGPPGHFRRVSYVDVLDGKVDPRLLEGKLVLVGVTAAGLGDGYPTPVSGHGALMPGVEIHANVLDSLLRGIDLRTAQPWQNALFTLFPVLLAMLGFHRLRARSALLMLPALVICVLAAAYLAQRFVALQFAPAAAILVVVVSYPLWSWQRLIAAVDYLAEEIRRTKAGDGMQMSHAVDEHGGDDLERNMQAMKDALDRLRELRQFVDDSLNGLPDATLVTDTEGTILLTNLAAQNLCESVGFSPLQGQSINEALARLCDASIVGPQFLAMTDVSGAESVAVDIEASTRTGRDLLMKFVPWKRSVHLRAGWIVSLIDISGVREAERQRDEALRFITHDMRSPQASIMATIELHRQGSVEGASHQVLDRIEQYALRTLALADEFTRLAQVENRDSAVQAFEAVDMGDVMIQAADQFWELARARNVRIHTEIPDESDKAVAQGDEAMLMRAVGNLVSNAVKFSPDGAEVVCAVTHSGGKLSVTVRDQGPGISEEDQKQLFEKFRRFRSQGTEQPDGIGLGLAYVKAVALRHMGTVTVSSTLGQGASFALTLPAWEHPRPDEA